MNFYKLINLVLKEQEENTLPDTPPDKNQQLDSVGKEEELRSALPSLEDLVYIKLIKLAVAALFTEVEDVLKKNVNLRSEAKKLKEYKPINSSTAVPALKLIRQLIILGGNPAEDITDIQNLDFASQSVLINLIINCLFSSKKELENSDPSISSQVSQIADDYRALSKLKNTNLENSIKIADSIKKNIEKILPATNLQFT